jgi:hypothetical protein
MPEHVGDHQLPNYATVLIKRLSITIIINICLLNTNTGLKESWHKKKCFPSQMRKLCCFAQTSLSHADVYVNVLNFKVSALSNQFISW